MNHQDEMVTTVVRALGSDKTHVVTIKVDSITGGQVFRVPFRGIYGTLNAHCGTLVRATKHFPMVVVMASGTKVRCVHCRRITGIETQA